LRAQGALPTVENVGRRATSSDLLLVLVVLASAAVVLTHVGGGHGRRSAFVADPVRTPGVVNPDVTQANIRTTICRRGWTATVCPPVDYTNALKVKQMRAYGETGSPSAYQEDQPVE
jgi:hypothetical protein